MASRLELTLAILKPHVLPNPFAHKWIKQRIVENGFNIVRSKIFHVDEQLAGSFYAEHEKKFFYGRLVSFMSSGPVEVLILAKENAIGEWRKMLGPTKVYKTVISHPESIRGMFGLTDTRNVGHGSGGLQSLYLLKREGKSKCFSLIYRLHGNIHQRDKLLLS